MKKQKETYVKREWKVISTTIPNDINTRLVKYSNNKNQSKSRTVVEALNLLFNSSFTDLIETK